METGLPSPRAGRRQFGLWVRTRENGPFSVLERGREAAGSPPSSPSRRRGTAPGPPLPSRTAAHDLDLRHRYCRGRSGGSGSSPRFAHGLERRSIEELLAVRAGCPQQSAGLPPNATGRPLSALVERQPAGTPRGIAGTWNPHLMLLPLLLVPGSPTFALITHTFFFFFGLT